MNRLVLWLTLLACGCLVACRHDATTAQTQSGPTRFTYRVVASHPHDPAAFTQGLIYYAAEDVMYEGTGLRGGSSLRKVDYTSGEVLQIVRLEDRYFGEGVTLWDDRLIQLTWQSRVGFVYDRQTFERRTTFDYPTEGWGITHDGRRLIMSDGTANLYFLDPETFEELGRVQVRDGDDRVVRLNELEYVEGQVFANVWQTNRIARIDPESGQVVGWIDLTGLLPLSDRTGGEGVLNGIAYDPAGKRLWVTGKLWPKLFQIELVPRGS